MVPVRNEAARPWLRVPISEGVMNRLAEQNVPPPADQARDFLAGLLLRTAQGDHQAFSKFYRHTSRQVSGLVQRVVIDRDLSDEVVQEIFIVVWQDAAKYQSAIGTPMVWLMMIAHRRAVDKVRANQSSCHRDNRWAATSPSAYHGVLDAVADKMDARILIASLACLSTLQRESIVLAYFGWLTYREISEKLCVPVPTIKSRIRDGLQRLRSQLEPVLQGDGVDRVGEADKTNAALVQASGEIQQVLYAAAKTVQFPQCDCPLHGVLPVPWRGRGGRPWCRSLCLRRCGRILHLLGQPTGSRFWSRVDTLA